jgi:hypothetical protein
MVWACVFVCSGVVAVRDELRVQSPGPGVAGDAVPCTKLATGSTAAGNDACRACVTGRCDVLSSLVHMLVHATGYTLLAPAALTQTGHVLWPSTLAHWRADRLMHASMHRLAGPMPHLVQGIAGVGDQLTQEHLAVGVQRVDDHVHEAVNLQRRASSQLPQQRQDPRVAALQVFSLGGMLMCRLLLG